MEFLVDIFIVFLRMGGLLMVFPLFLMMRIPVSVRLALAMLLGVLMGPHIPQTLDLPSLSIGEFVSIMFFEMLAGILLGFVCRMVFHALEIAGLRISTDAGLFITMNFAGMEGVPQQAPGIILFLLASILTVTLDIHYHIFVGVRNSYLLLPVGGGQISEGVIAHFSSLISNIFLLGVLIASPVMVMGFLINFIMAMMGRAVQKISIFAESFSIRLICGITVFGATIALMAEHIANYLRRLPNELVITARIFAGN